VYPGGTSGDTCSGLPAGCVDACYAAWGVAGIATPGTTTNCTDGAFCDQDHAANGTCVIQYEYCLNTVPQGTVTCSIRDIKRVALVNPDTTIISGDRTAFLDSVDAVLKRSSGITTRDADGVTRSVGANYGDLCGSGRVTVTPGTPRKLVVATTDSGNPSNSLSNQRTDRDEITFGCTAP
jgi:hypothetical protein